ncbi:hypothetical protein M3J09_004140 [Ascochyta lentis]
MATRQSDDRGCCLGSLNSKRTSPSRLISTCSSSEYWHLHCQHAWPVSDLSPDCTREICFSAPESHDSSFSVPQHEQPPRAGTGGVRTNKSMQVLHVIIHERQQVTCRNPPPHSCCATKCVIGLDVPSNAAGFTLSCRTWFFFTSNQPHSTFTFLPPTPPLSTSTSIHFHLHLDPPQPNPLMF